MKKTREVKGQCARCRFEAKIDMLVEHIKECPALQQRMVAVEEEQPLLLVKVQARPFWLIFLARGNATMRQLHDLVDELWLEGTMCGHASAVTFKDGKTIQLPDYFGGGDLPESTKLSRLVGSSGRVQADYQYDFGTTTSMSIEVERVVAQSKQQPEAPLVLVGRNSFPSTLFKCKECNKAARYQETEDWRYLCKACLESEVGRALDPQLSWPDQGTLGLGQFTTVYRVWNSPRTGACGYDGPDDAAERAAMHPGSL